MPVDHVHHRASGTQFIGLEGQRLERLLRVVEADGRAVDDDVGRFGASRRRRTRRRAPAARSGVRFQIATSRPGALQRPGGGPPGAIVNFDTRSLCYFQLK